MNKNLNEQWPFFMVPMMEIIFVWNLLIFSVGAVLPAAKTLEPAKEKTPDGQEIFRQCELQDFHHLGEETSIELKIQDREGRTASRLLQSKSWQEKLGERRMLLTVEAPADLQGGQFLSWTHEKQADDVWLYLKAFRRVKRIQGHLKGSSFMGSDFSYIDVVGLQRDQYRFEQLPDDKWEEHAAWVLKLVPLENDNPYGYLVVWLGKEYCRPLKIDYYGKNKQLEKVATFSGYHVLKAGKKSVYRPQKVEMKNVHTDSQSTFNWTNWSIKPPFSAATFNRQHLGK